MDATNGKSMEEGKIFVGGLSWETKDDALKAHFSQFGTVREATVMTETATKKPRGFGFVTFEECESVQRVMDYCKKKPGQPGIHHMIDGKQVDPKPAYMKGGPPDQGCGKKIFVGGIDHNSTDDDVHAYFSQYGTVLDIDLKVDKSTNRKRGFAFVTFEKEDAVDKVIQMHFHQLNGKTVECKKAQPRNQTQGAKSQQSQVYGGAAPYGGYATTGGGDQTAYYGGYGMQPAYTQQQQQQYTQQQAYAPAGNYMRGGYGPQSAAGGYAMGRGDPSMHNPSVAAAAAVGVHHQGHMTQAGYGRGQDAGSYGGAAGYGQAATGGGGAYGQAPQTAYNYESMPQVGGSQATATAYAGYSDTAASAGYTVGGAAPPQHKPQKTTYNYY